jgi:TolA-binding protein
MKNLYLLIFVLLFASCSKISPSRFLADIEMKAENINRYERVALSLAKENRRLQGEIGRLESQLQEVTSKNNFLAMQLNKSKGSRKIASVGPANPSNDLVKYDVYNWSPKQILAVARTEFKKKNFEKSAQFFKTFLTRFPNHKEVREELLFQAGLAAYESRSHNDWVMSDLGKIVSEYPNSKYYRGAKLWMALTNLRMGKKGAFFNTVEEFRKKYRNTSEWKILSAHYEKIANKYKR